MYNKEIKKEFMKFKESKVKSSEKILPRLFNQSEGREIDRDRDIALWTRDEIVQFYIDRHSISKNSLQNMNRYFGSYVDWCNKHGYINSDNVFNTFEITELEKYVDQEKKQQRYITTNQYLEYVDELINPVHQFILECLFEGIKGEQFEDIWKLKLDDISKKETYIRRTGKTIKTNRRLYDFAKESAKEGYYYSYGANGKMIKFRQDPRRIIKETNGKQFLIQDTDDPVMIKRQDKNIARKFVVIRHALEWEVSPKTLVMSGQMNHLISLCKEESLSIDAGFLKYRSMLEDRYGEIKDQRVFKHITKQLKQS